MSARSSTARAAGAWPWLFLPFGFAPAVVAGYLTIAVADELARAGVPLGSVSAIVTAMFLPAALTFAWAPLVDTIGRRQRWLLAGIGLLGLAAAGLALNPRTPSGLPLLVSFAALAGFGYSLVSVAQKGMAVELFAPSRRVAAAGWAGAGAGFGLALGGGVLTVSAHVSPIAVTCLLVAVVALPAVGALGVVERYLAVAPAAKPTLRAVAQDSARLLGSRRGRLALAICVLPFATSATALMVGTLGVDFEATSTVVGAWAGPAKSVAFAAGALVGARVWQRIGTRAGYLVAGIGFVLLELLVLAVPQTPTSYAAMACGFGFLQGASLSAILGIILETVEPRAASTQAAVLVAAANLSNVYLPPVAGLAHDAGGLSALLLVDAALGLAGLTLFLLSAHILRLHPWRHHPSAG